MGTEDKIQKQITLRAPLSRVWNALTDSKQFGTWFGCALDGPFVAGKTTQGTIQPTKVDADVAKMQEPYTGTPFQVVVERIEPMRVFSFHWHPCAVEPKDHKSEPMTLVEFTLHEIEPGTTQLKITESGFDRVPLERRAEAFTKNDDGWTHQTKMIEKYIDGQAA